MKKLLLAVASAALALSIVPAHATPGAGCAAGGAAQDAALSCTYTAGAAGKFVAATPNGWTITAQRGSQTITLRSSGTLGVPSQGALATQAGDVVTITVGPDDADPAPVTGSIGVVAAADAS